MTENTDPPSSDGALTLRACLLVATVFWLYMSATVITRWELLRQALPSMHVPPATVMTLESALLFPLLLLLVSVSWRIGYDPARWRTIAPRHLLLALLFGLCSRPALMVARALHDQLPLADAALRLNGSDVVVAAKLWISGTVDDGMQYVVLQAILAGCAFYTRFRHEQAQRVRLAGLYEQARLQALRMQINPHFLFNTLGAVAGLVRTRPEAAEAMVTRLGDLLRTTLVERDAEFVSIEQELTTGLRYLEIQQARFDERLTFTIDADPLARSAAIPPLLLQPLLENAVEHGLGTQEGAVAVIVLARHVRGRVTIEVRNRLAPSSARSSHRGYRLGLENVRERLLTAFGPAATFVAGPSPDGYFDACLEFPRREAPRDEEASWAQRRSA